LEQSEELEHSREELKNSVEALYAHLCHQRHLMSVDKWPELSGFFESLLHGRREINRHSVAQAIELTTESIEWITQ
jgi:hypothetical protein